MVVSNPSQAFCNSLGNVCPFGKFAVSLHRKLSTNLDNLLHTWTSWSEKIGQFVFSSTTCYSVSDR